MESKTTIYTQLQDMRPHQQMELQDWRVLRVPGGWIYSSFRDIYGTSVFVPEIALNMGGEPCD